MRKRRFYLYKFLRSIKYKFICAILDTIQNIYNGKGILGFFYIIFHNTLFYIWKYKLNIFYILLVLVVLRGADYCFVYYCLEYQKDYFSFLPLKLYQQWRYSYALETTNSKMTELVEVLIKNTPFQPARSGFFEGISIEDPAQRANFFENFQKDYVEKPYRKLSIEEMALVLKDHTLFELRAWDIFLTENIGRKLYTPTPKGPTPGTLLSNLMMEEIKTHYYPAVDQLNKEQSVLIQHKYSYHIPFFAYGSVLFVLYALFIPLYAISRMRSDDFHISMSGIDLMREYIDVLQIEEGANLVWQAL